MFSDLGYDGVSVRQIALRAKVPVTLIGYHFEDKLGVYRAIFELRTQAVMELRKSGLALAELEDDPDRRLEMIVRAVLLPMLKLRTQEHESHFGVLLAREVSDPRSSERGIVREMLDPIAELVSDTLSRTLKGFTKAQINWAYQILIGVMVYIMADAGRIKRLSDGECDPDDVDATMRGVVPLLLNGLRGGLKLTKEADAVRERRKAE